MVLVLVTVMTIVEDLPTVADPSKVRRLLRKEYHPGNPLASPKTGLALACQVYEWGGQRVKEILFCNRKVYTENSNDKSQSRIE